MTWTPMETSELRQLHSAGLSVRQIADRIGTGDDRVRNKLLRMFGARNASVTRWPAQRQAEVREMIEDGCSGGQIAEALGLTKGQVAGWVDRMIGPGAFWRSRYREVVTTKDRLDRLWTLAPASGCGHPLGEPGRPGFRYCGEPISGNKGLCAEHHRLCWVRAPKTHGEARLMAGTRFQLPVGGRAENRTGGA